MSALFHALAHNLALAWCVLAWELSLGLLMLAVWFELSVGAMLLCVLATRSSHGRVLVEAHPELLRADRPRPTLRRRSGELLVACVGLGVVLAVLALGLLLGPAPYSRLLAMADLHAVGLALLACLLGLAFQLWPQRHGLMRDEASALLHLYRRGSGNFGHAMVLLLLVPWSALLVGPDGVVLIFFLARVLSDYRLGLNEAKAEPA